MYDEIHVLNIETAGREVGGNEEQNSAQLKLLNGSHPVVLLHTPMEADRWHLELIKSAPENLALLRTFRENDPLTDLVIPDLKIHWLAVILVDHVDAR